MSRRVIFPENSLIITEKLEDEPLPPEIEKHHEGNENHTHIVTSGVTTITQQVVVTIQNHTQVVTPPYLKTLAIAKIPPQLEFNLLGELQNLCIKILLLQALRDVPIYIKIIWEF
jgi:hypothetical protein